MWAAWESIVEVCSSLITTWLYLQTQQRPLKLTLLMSGTTFLLTAFKHCLTFTRKPPIKRCALSQNDIYMSFLKGRSAAEPQVLQRGLFAPFFPLVMQYVTAGVWLFVGNGMTSTSCFGPHQSRQQGHSSAITWPSATLSWAAQSSIVLPHDAFYHRRCLIVKTDMWDRAVSVTVWTAHAMAHRPCCSHGSREKTENTLPSPAASQRLNEVAACLSALWGESQITDNEAVPFQDMLEIELAQAVKSNINKHGKGLPHYPEGGARSVFEKRW